MLEKTYALAEHYLNSIITWGSSPQFYIQLGLVVSSIIFALLTATLIRHKIANLQLSTNNKQANILRTVIFHLQSILSPLFIVIFLGLAANLAEQFIHQNWLIKIGQSLALINLLYAVVQRFIQNTFIKFLFKWVGIPLAVLQVFNWLDNVTLYLDSLALQIGDIRLSALAITRGIIFGAVLFWLGRHSNTAGQKVIRNNQALDSGTKELFSKLFEVFLYVIVFILLLQIIGINLTTLAVLGGALGVGLGFGLQQIAANFISGIIILLDRSIRVGDNIELSDGSFGILREIKMRYSIIESYEGKEMMVPNETFITNAFTNWSHKDDKQRYHINFSVSYSTDLHLLIDVVRKAVAAHPQVISGEDAPLEECPDVEIDDFGDSGINIRVEYWMHGVDDGVNRVDADLKLIIWETLREHKIQMPFPQREVRILSETDAP